MFSDEEAAAVYTHTSHNSMAPQKKTTRASLPHLLLRTPFFNAFC